MFLLVFLHPFQGFYRFWNIDRLHKGVFLIVFPDDSFRDLQVLLFNRFVFCFLHLLDSLFLEFMLPMQGCLKQCDHLLTFLDIIKINLAFQGS